MLNYKLETIEWTNFWREDANDQQTPRVLLIGDSISVGYRHLVEQKLAGNAHVSVVSTSKAIDNPFFLEEIDLFAKQETVPYSVIHFNNGLHSGGLSADVYMEYYEKAVEHLATVYPNAKIILALSTSVVTTDDLNKLSEQNRVATERNEKVLAFAKKCGYPVDDLYAVSVSKENLHVPDGVHFSEEGSEILADEVTKSIMGALFKK